MLIAEDYEMGSLESAGLRVDAHYAVAATGRHFVRILALRRSEDGTWARYSDLDVAVAVSDPRDLESIARAWRTASRRFRELAIGRPS